MYAPRSIDTAPLIDQPAHLRYLNFFYWAVSFSSSGAYGDMLAASVLEKAIQASSLLLFRVYYAFIVAEISAIISSEQYAYSDHVDKVDLITLYLFFFKILLFFFIFYSIY